LPFSSAAAIAALAPWDVIFPFDNRINPSKHKMWVCVSRTDLWFLRINTQIYNECCVLLSAASHPFLRYDSFMGCGGNLIDVAEAELEQLLTMQRVSARQGKVGAIDPSVRPSVCAGIASSPRLSLVQKTKMAAELGCASPLMQADQPG
jgi:hypothetical protein